MRKKFIYLLTCTSACALIALNFAINSQSVLISNITLANSQALAGGGESGASEIGRINVDNGSCSYTVPTENGFTLRFGNYYTCEDKENYICFSGCY